MLFNLKYRLWLKVSNWWNKFKPSCRHWFKVVSSAPDGRKEIEISICRWCDQLTSELYVKGEKFDNHFENIRGYGPVEACPITDDPPVVLRTGPVITLPNRELYFERNPNVVSVNRNSRTRTKAKSASRQSLKSRTRR